MTETDCDWFLNLWAESFDGSPAQPPHSIYQPITSPIHQTGKTSFALREAEIVLERLKGRKMDPRNISFNISDFMVRRKEISAYDIQILDEPQRAASSRNWHAEDQNILAEDLMASNRYLKPALFPTPLTGMVDNRIFDIMTSQAVVERLGFVNIYYPKRDQLNRNKKRVPTPKLGSLTFDKPSAVLWHAYCKMFDEDYEQRRTHNLERVQAILAESNKNVSAVMPEDMVTVIMQEPQKYIGKSGNISPVKVKSEFKVPYNRAQEAATEATKQLKRKEDLEEAEREAV